VHHFDEPFGDSSALPTFMVSQMARRHVTVALSGDGGDEAFAGYQSHAIHLRDEGFHKRVPAPVRQLVGAGLAAGARASGHGRLVRAAGAVRRANRPLAERFCNVFTKEERRQLFAADLRREIGTPREEALFAGLGRAQRFPDFLAGILYADTKAYLTNDILVKVDRASMANSLEVRSPLVDHHVLEFAARIPSAFKLRDGTSKYIFKKTVESFVPREIVYREKHGFGVPVRSWFRTELRDMLHDHLLASDDAGARLFDRAYVERLVREHTTGRRDWSGQLWPLLVFRMWYRRSAP
jgi:asparagine synthase (glutamine-hydrolysing)